MNFAFKRISAVELNKQHEFHAGALHRSLGFPTTRTVGRLDLLFFVDDEEDATTDESDFTLYNAREGKPRSAEYRLYYSSSRMAELAREGDLCVIFRPDETNRLVGIIAKSGTSAERELLDALDADPALAMEKFASRRVNLVDPEQLSFVSATVPAPSNAAQKHPLLEHALARRTIPRPEQISAAAQQSVLARFGDLDADRFILESTNEESALYFSIERAVKEEQLKAMIRSQQATLANVLGFSLSIHQSRRSRRGQSLQFHFASLLSRENIPFTAQCQTENGETPDIVVPGQAAYANPDFPSELLRMVACKTTVRERWSQVTREAARIPDKYLLTLDEHLSPDAIRNMTTNHRLSIFIPRTIREQAYRSVDKLGTITELIQILTDVASEVSVRSLRS